MADFGDNNMMGAIAGHFIGFAHKHCLGIGQDGQAIEVNPVADRKPISLGIAARTYIGNFLMLGAEDIDGKVTTRCCQVGLFGYLLIDAHQ